ncbi:hypothetical protein DPV78_007637 [Talaromyces pinophilus]|nr:hypothetical protein DPV78_007637 [Talaromyces pinophilus]
MPDLELVGALNGPSHLDRPLLKGHKSLPRRRQPRPRIEMFDNTSPSDVKDDIINGGDLPITPTLPLTPPNQVQEDTQTDSPPRLNGQPSLPLSLRNMATPATGSHQFSPPTPDVTPPRAKDPTPKARPVFPSLQSSTTSRADSFQTARENLSDDDTIDGLYPPAHSLVVQKRQRSFPEPSPLANGFDSISNSTEEEQDKARDDATDTGRVTKSSVVTEKNQDAKRTTRLASSPLPKSQIRKRSGQKHQNTAAPEKETLETAPSGLKKEPHSMRKNDQSPKPSDLDKVDGEVAPDLTDTEQKLVDRVNTWRHSGASFTSTIEAMVIETSPPKQRTLRHTEKRTSLRSVSSPQPRSTRTSTESNGDSSHRLVHKSGRISNENRNSVASDMSAPVSITSTNREVHEVIPVVVVPQRRSSLKSSAPSTRNQSVVPSTTSSRRKASVSRSRASDQHAPQRSRTMSDAGSSAAGQSGRESRGRGVGHPPIPARSSSLSAPTSRNNSRTTSLTSDSLRRHTEQMQLAFEVPPYNKPSDVLPSPRIVLHEGSDPANGDASVSAYPQRNAEDMERLHAPSLHFTQSSVVSYSPGPIEINEATMVTYFPHNNDSLLVINPYVQPESKAVKALRGQDLSEPVALRTPEHSTAALDVESPLRNPRTPPKPPTQKAVLPEPVDSRQSGTELSRQGSNRLSRGFGSVKRALSARRNSDGVHPQPPTRSLSVRSARSRRAEKARDSQLYSFWRPRGFWDDFDSSPSNERGPVTPDQQYRYQTTTDREDTYVSNSLGLPQKRVIFSGPLVLARRISKSRKARRQQVRRQQLSHSDLNLAMGIVRPHSPYQRQTVKYRLQKGVLFPVRSFRNIRRRVKEARQQRARAALEARRERLKQSIGPKKLTDPYAVGPFNHGVPYEDDNTSRGY